MQGGTLGYIATLKVLKILHQELKKKDPHVSPLSWVFGKKRQELFLLLPVPALLSDKSWKLEWEAQFLLRTCLAQDRAIAMNGSTEAS